MNQTFEQQTANAIRTLNRVCVVLAAALVMAIGLAAWGFLKAESDAAALKASVQSPTHGKDIAIWCSAIDADRTYNRTFVRNVTRGSVTYRLGDLNCAQIEAAEAASSRTKR